MKPVAFSLNQAPACGASTSKRVHEDDNTPTKQSITEFVVGAKDGGEREERKVIPSKPNRLPSKLQKKDDADALGTMEDRFEKAAVRQTVGEGVYGLVPTDSAQPDSGYEHTKAQTAGKSSLTDDLPDAPTAEYEDMPVDQFATALLRGMGLKKHHVVPTVELVARPSRMGLGAKVGDMNLNKRSYKQLVGADGSTKSIIRKGEEVIDAATLGPKVGKKMTIVSGRHSGLDCIIQALNEGGNEGSIKVRLLPSERDAVVAEDCLSEPGMRPRSSPAEHAAQPSSCVHETHRRDSNAGEPTTDANNAREDSRKGRNGGASDDRRRRSDRERDRERGRDRDSDRDRDRTRTSTHDERRDSSYRDRDRDKDRHRDSNRRRDREHDRGGSLHGMERHADKGGERGESGKHLDRGRDGPGVRVAAMHKSWLREGVRVRVVNQHLARGRAYLSKAVIMVVVGPGQCNVLLENGSVLEGVHEPDLETVISKKPGAALLVVGGEHRGEHARLLEKGKQFATVQLAGSREVVQLDLDDVADFQAAPDEDHW